MGGERVVFVGQVGRNIGEDGTVFYLNEGNLYHRVDGPAVVYFDGSEAWYRDGELHRVDGPAVITKSCERWLLEACLHREDGPAVVWGDGEVEYWVDGKKAMKPTKTKTVR